MIGRYESLHSQTQYMTCQRERSRAPQQRKLAAIHARWGGATYCVSCRGTTSVRQSRLSIALARKLDAKSQLCRLRRARRLRALVAGGNPQPGLWVS
jgi:hypothetical protein